MLRQATHSLSIRANRPGLHEFTDDVRSILSLSGISNGLATLFCRHTSASLVIQENAAPAARRDLERYFECIAPEDDSYEHDDEGPDDMPAHLRSALTQSQLSRRRASDDLVEQPSRFVGHSEAARPERFVDVLRRGAGERDLEVVNDTGPVHGQR